MPLIHELVNLGVCAAWVAPSLWAIVDSNVWHLGGRLPSHARHRSKALQVRRELSGWFLAETAARVANPGIPLGRLDMPSVKRQLTSRKAGKREAGKTESWKTRKIHPALPEPSNTERTSRSGGTLVRRARVPRTSKGQTSTLTFWYVTCASQKHHERPVRSRAVTLPRWCPG